MNARRIVLSLIAGFAIVWLIRPSHQRFVVEDMSKPQTFTYNRYLYLLPSGISLKIKGEVRNGAANIVLHDCASPYPIGKNQYVGKVDASLGGDYFQHKACIDYIPVRTPEGRLEFTISIH